MFIVLRPITLEIWTCEQTTKQQTNYCCCLQFSYLTSDWLLSLDTITFQKYFQCPWFSKFDSKYVNQLGLRTTIPHWRSNYF